MQNVMTGVTARVLEKAADRIDRGWTQASYARDVFGAKIAPNDEDAVCWCAEGALAAEYDNGRAIDALRDEVGGAVWMWNDHPNRTAAEVASAMRRAAANLRTTTEPSR